ncbi:MAG: hypothetical protein ACRC8W_12480 [Plesiomonas shigelloides]
MKEAKVKITRRWFVECPCCGAEHDVDPGMLGKITCICEMKFMYNNQHPELAEDD